MLQVAVIVAQFIRRRILVTVKSYKPDAEPAFESRFGPTAASVGEQYRDAPGPSTEEARQSANTNV